MAFIVNPTSGDLDVLRVVEFPYRGATPTTRLNINDGVIYNLVSGTFKVTPPDRNQQMALSGRRYGGAVLANEIHGNGQISAEWYIRGTTSTQANTYAEALLRELEEIEDHRGRRFIAWQPSGATYPVLYELRAATPWEPQYRWVEYAQTKTLHIAAGVQVAPLAQGLPMFISDRFDVDTKADYEQLIGNYADWTITGGALNSTANFGTDTVILHKDRGYTYGDLSYTIHGRVGTPNGIRVGAVTKVKDSLNYIRLFVRGTSVNTFATIETVEAGVSTQQTAVALGSALIAGAEFYVRVWNEGPRFYVTLWLNGKTPEETPDLIGTYTASSPQNVTFGRGVYGKAGLYWRGVDANDKILDWTARPFRYQAGNGDVPGATVPEIQRLDGIIPGSAPAKVDVEVYTNGIATQQVWGMIAWSPKFNPFNFVWNGDFADDADGWSVAATAASPSLHAAGSSIARSTAQAPPGATGSGGIVLPATLNAGAHFKVYRQFNRGITYTLKILARASTGSPTASAGIGSTTSSVGASGTQTLSSTGWTELTATWTPTGNTNEAYVYIRSEVATAFTLYIGGVRFYAGTVEPTAHPQSEGRGAFPPFGRVKTMNRDASRSTGWASITELSNDTTLIQTSLTSSAWEMLFDPSLLSSDPFTGEEIQLEIWGRISVNTAPVKIITSVLPQSQVGTSRHTNEYGQLGKIVQPQGSSGLDYRTIRLGTIPVVADPHNPARYRLRVSFSKAGVSSPNVAFEEIYLVQPSRRALGPTGKPNDLAYPRFLPGVSARKRVFSDLSGEAAALNGPAWFPDHGLGGSFIEFEPGDNNLVFLRLNDRVPDDPTTGVAETGSVNAGMVFDVTPRWHLLRD